MSMGEALSLAQLVSKFDSTGRKAMAPFLEGGESVREWMPKFRRAVKFYLQDPKAPIVKATHRKRLQDWATTYGIESSKNGDLKTNRVRGSFTDPQYEDLIQAAELVGKSVSDFLVDAAMREVNRLRGAA
jgi:hypothetical protein